MTLAHVARPYRLAQAAAAAGYRVVIAAAGYYDRLLPLDEFQRLPLTTLAPALFGKRLRRGSPLYDLGTLKGYVREDLAHIEAVQPDLILSDFRVSLCVSARLAGIPTLSLSNGYWHPTARLEIPCPSLGFRRFMPAAWADALFRRIYPLAFRLHCRPFNRLRRAFGLEPDFTDIRQVYTWGDATLFADLPGLIRHRELPPSCTYLGPLLWAPAQAQPAWWGQWQAAPLVYLNLGSSGPAHLLDRLIRWCLAAGWQVLAATGANPAVARQWAAHPGVFCAPALAGDAAARAAQAVINNGGSPSAYQALAEGRPVIGICENLDQYLNMAALEPLGATLGLRSDAVSGRQLRDALDWAGAKATGERAREVQGRIRDCAPDETFVRQLHGLQEPL